MLRRSTTSLGWLFKAGTLLLSLLLLGLLGVFATFAFKANYVPKSQRGEFGGDLRLLRSFYSPPRGSGESNYIIDMLKFGHFGEFLHIQGLTNNHALFVLSHGRALPKSTPRRYAYYPDEGVFQSSEIPYFSARDLAQVLGPEHAAQIHNLILAGCNREGAFDPAEVKKYFPCATNVTHTPAGENGFEYVYRHALVYTGKGNKTLYQPPGNLSEDKISQGGSAGNHKARLRPYLAELYLEGEEQPFKIITAGRELLDPATGKLNSSSHSFRPQSPLMASASTKGETKKPIPQAVPQPKSLILLPDSKEIKPDAKIFAEGWLAQVLSLLNFPFLGIWRGPILSGLLAVCFLLLGVRFLALGIRQQS